MIPMSQKGIKCVQSSNKYKLLAFKKGLRDVDHMHSFLINGKA